MILRVFLIVGIVVCNFPFRLKIFSSMLDMLITLLLFFQLAGKANPVPGSNATFEFEFLSDISFGHLDFMIHPRP